MRGKPGVQAPAYVFGLTGAGDGNAVQTIGGAEFPKQIAPIAIGQAKVAQEQVHHAQLGGSHRGGTTLGGLNVITLLRKKLCHRQIGIGVVINHQNSCDRLVAHVTPSATISLELETSTTNSLRRKF